MDTAIAQLGADSGLLAEGIFYVAYFVLMIAHAINKMAFLAIIVAVASFYIATQTVMVNPLIGILFVVIGIAYLLAGLRRWVNMAKA